jgi:hypothetical protein
MTDPMKQRTYAQNLISKGLKVNFGLFRPVFRPSGQERRFMQVNLLINGVPLFP